MIRCIVKHCEWETNSIDRLYQHLNKIHGSISTYICNYEGCSRNYSVRASFFRHYKKHHEEIVWRHIDTQQESRAANEVPETSERDKVFPEKTQCEKEEQASGMEFEDNHMPPEKIDAIIDVDELANKIRNLSINLNLKWLNTDTLPRKTVFDLQRDVRMSILQPFKETITSMETVGLIPSESGLIFKKMFDIFDGTETEYKLIQQLKRSDLYTEPREFIISNELRAGVVNNQQLFKNDQISGKFLYFSRILYPICLIFVYRFRCIDAYAVPFKKVFGIDRHASNGNGLSFSV